MGAGADSARSTEGSPARPGESTAERLDRNYAELLQEMRVLQAGMQILFAFMLSLPFQTRFTEVSDFQRGTYVVTLVAACLATACIIGPVSFHRLIFRRGMKADLIRAAGRYVAAGLALLFVSMCGAVLLVLDFLLSPLLAYTITGSLSVIFVVLWVAAPLVVRGEDDHETVSA